MKNVFSSNESLCHEYANQTQETGRTGNMFFEGVSLYSYGYHYELARVVENNTMLIADCKYSNSTAKQGNKLRIASNHYNRVPVFGHVGSNQTKLAYSELLAIDLKYNRAINKGKYLRDAMRIIIKLNIISAFLPQTSTIEFIDITTKFEKLYENFDFAAERAKQEIKDQAKEIRDIAKRAEQSKTYAEKLENWLSGASSFNLPYSYNTNSYLRIKNNEVQTSMGVHIPLKEAKLLFTFIQAYKLGSNIAYKLDNRFNVQSITSETVTIGCHTIDMSEINRIGIQL